MEDGDWSGGLVNGAGARRHAAPTENRLNTHIVPYFSY